MIIDKIISACFRNNNIRFKQPRKHQGHKGEANFSHSSTANALEVNRGVTQEMKMLEIMSIETGDLNLACGQKNGPKYIRIWKP